MRECLNTKKIFKIDSPRNLYRKKLCQVNIILVIFYKSAYECKYKFHIKSECDYRVVREIPEFVLFSKVFIEARCGAKDLVVLLVAL